MIRGKTNFFSRGPSWSLGLLILWIITVGRLNGAGITLTWDPSPSANVAGYAIYYGTATGIFPQRLDVGNQTIASISGLTAGVTYYFVVKAYAANNLESLPSNEISYTVPPFISISITAQGPKLTWTSSLGRTYRVVYKNKLSDTQWTNASSTLLGTSLPLQWVDTGASTSKQRFYSVVLLP